MHGKIPKFSGCIFCALETDVWDEASQADKLIGNYPECQASRLALIKENGIMWEFFPNGRNENQYLSKQ